MKLKHKFLKRDNRNADRHIPVIRLNDYVIPDSRA
jgi:hypothetical protein